MDCEDDICVLEKNGDDQPNLTFSSFASPASSVPLSSSIIDPGSYHALQKAYVELKKRLNDTTYRNEQLTKRVLELESLKDNSCDLGGSYDMMEDNSYVEAGVPMSVAPDPQVAAEEGYVQMLKRELGRTKHQVQILERQYQEGMEKNEANYNLLAQKLQETETRLRITLREKDDLQQTLDSLRGNESGIEKLTEKCRSLEIERGKAVKEAMSSAESLRRVQQELAELKEKQGDSLNADAPQDVVKEVAHLRRVIDSLKNMVLTQRSYLSQMESRSSSMSMRGSLGRSLKDPSSVEQDMSPPTSNRSAGSASGQSWEMVNGAVPQSSLDKQKQLQQQQRQVSSGYVMSVNQPGLPASFPGCAVSHVVNGGMNAGRTAMSGGQSWSRVENVHSGQIMSTGQNMAPAQAPGQPTRKASTEVIRRKSEEDVLERRCKTEYIRGASSQSPNLADWMGNHFQHQSGGNISNGQPSQTGFNQPQPAVPGYVQHSQVQQQQGVGMNAMASQPQPPQPQATPYRQSQPQAFPQTRQISPSRDLPSTYDNLHYGNRPPNGNMPASTGISMHIFNQGVLSGGRVVQANSDSFGSGTTTPTGSHIQTSVSAALGRDGGQRLPPQEHSDLTLSSRTASPNPTDLLPPDAASQPTRSAEDRKCPVCSQDFPHTTMDEFQTHVFDCFDDAEESPCPETLQPQTTRSSTDRVCPMCSKKFDETQSQQFFELHVQSHFEEADPFEVLQVPNP